MEWSLGPDNEKPKCGLCLLSQDSPQHFRAVGWAFGSLASLTKDRNVAKIPS